MMVGFLCVGAAQAAVAGILLWRRPGALLLIAALALTAGAIGTWLISRTLGLPFLPGGHMEPIGFKDGVTVLFELASLPGLLLLASSDLAACDSPARASGRRPWRASGPPPSPSSSRPSCSAAASTTRRPSTRRWGTHSHGAGEEHADGSHGGVGEHLDGEHLASVDANDHAHGSGEPHAAGDDGGASHDHAAAGGAPSLFAAGKPGRPPRRRPRRRHGRERGAGARRRGWPRRRRTRRGSRPALRRRRGPRRRRLPRRRRRARGRRRRHGKGGGSHEKGGGHDEGGDGHEGDGHGGDGGEGEEPRGTPACPTSTTGAA